MGGENKKTVIALCLVAVMALMWVRVLLRKSPQTAEAGLPPGELKTEVETRPEVKMAFIELPKVKGRNDVLSRDFFAADDWRDFVNDGKEKVEKVKVVSGDGSEEAVRRVADKLKLQAIWSGANPQAFVNDKLLSVGDRFTVREGGRSYECEVVRIRQNTVFIRCGEAEITLKLAQVIEGVDL